MIGERGRGRVRRGRRARGALLAGGVFLLLSAGALPGAAGCACERSALRSAGGEFRELTDWLTGSFSSAAQAAADSAFYDIRLQMTRIWHHRSDAYWLYVEQAVAGHEARPYRQRIYRVTPCSPGLFQSAVYRLPGEARFIGAGGSPGIFIALTPDSLSERTGCAIYLRRRDRETFVGETVGRECPSSLHGATFATSEVTLTRDLLTSWDRGFDDAGEQIWGAVKGGYRFRRVASPGRAAR